MAAFARLLAAGRLSQTLAEELDCQKLTPKYLHRELREADEANLLDEEDMHMFGLRPMSDPLYLVCCNACKKPIKASHYAAHAELCKSLNCKEEIVSEVDGASGQKKLQRKDRKKLHIAHATTTNWELEKFESLGSDIFTAPESPFDAELQMIPLAGAKRNTQCLNETPRMNSLKVNIGNMERSETVIPSPTKYVKRAISEIQSCPDVRTPCITSEDILQCRELPTRSSGGSEKISKGVVGNQTSDQIYENLVTKEPKRIIGPRRGFHCNHGSQKESMLGLYKCGFSITFDGSNLGVAISDVPAPLATKMYYSQRNHYLRRVLSLMYYAESRKEQSSEFRVNSEHTQTLSPSYLNHGQVENPQRDEHSLHLGQTPDQIHAGNSKLYFVESRGFVSASNISSPFPVNNTMEPHSSIGNIRSNYIPNSSFAGRTGKPLGTVPLANGSVPVV